MSYSVEVMEELVDKAKDRLAERLTLANREERLLVVLTSLEMQDLLSGLTIEPEPEVMYSKTGKILIVGDLAIGEDKLKGVAKTLGVKADRLVFKSFSEAKNFNFQQIQYQNKYAVILFGPVGHSGRGMEKHSSIITHLEQEDGYPPVRRMNANGGL